MAAIIRAIACSADRQERLDALDALRCLPPDEADPAAEAVFRVRWLIPGDEGELALRALSRDPGAVGPRTFTVLVRWDAHWMGRAVRRIPADRRAELMRRAWAEAADDRRALLRLAEAAAEADLAGPEVISALAGFAATGERGMRSWAAGVLGRIGPSAADALPAIRHLADTDEETAARALVGIAVRLDDESETLTTCLTRNDRLWFGLSFPARHLPALIRWLESPERKLRMLASKTLAAFGRAAGPDAVPPLRRWLAAADPAERLMAVRVPGELGPAARPAVADLADVIDNDPRPWMRSAAVISLGQIGGPEARAVLRRVLRAPAWFPVEADLPREAYLWPHGDVIGPWTASWTAAAWAFGEMGADSAAGGEAADADEIARRLSRLPPDRGNEDFPDDPDHRGYLVEQAERSLSRLDGAAVPAALRMAADPATHVRRRGFRVLARLGSRGHGGEVVAALERGLWDAEADIRVIAAGGLGHGPPVSEKAVRRLAELSAADVEFAWPLARMGPCAAAALPDIGAMLEAGDHRFVIGARAAAAIGRPAAALAPKLLYVPRQPGALPAAIRALRAVGGLAEAEQRKLWTAADGPVDSFPSAAILLAAGVGEPWAGQARAVVRSHSAFRDRGEALVALGPLAADAADPVVARLESEAPSHDNDATPTPGIILAAMGPAARSALPELRAYLSGADPAREPVRAMTAVVALWRIGGDAAECGEQFSRLYPRTPPGTPWEDEFLAVAAETGHPSAARAVAVRLENRRPDVRLAAARTLARFPPGSAASALAALAKCLEDPNAEVRRAALSAVMRITGGP
jgi:HEAT repeat protein